MLTNVPSEKKEVRSRGPISADERHSYAEEEIGASPAGVKYRERGGDWGRESGRLTKELEVERRGVTLAVKTNAREKARAATNLVKQSRNLLVSRHSLRLALASTAASRPSAPISPLQPAPSPARLSLLLSLSLCSSSLSCTSTSAAASLAHVARHLCSARSRMREIRWRVAGCGAQSGAPLTALAIMLNRFCTVDEPLSGPEQSKLVEEGSVGRARSTRGAGGRHSPVFYITRQTLPTPWPIGTALAQDPDRSRRRPGSGLHSHTEDFLKKARSW